MIPNTNPPTVGTFNQWWITFCQILPCAGTQPARVQAAFAPSDGTDLLGTRSVSINEGVPSTNSGFAAALAALLAEIAALSGQSAAPTVIQVSAPSPAGKVAARVIFKQPASPAPAIAPYPVSDCYGLAATNTAFAAAFNGMLAAVAGLAGLTVTA